MWALVECMPTTLMLPFLQLTAIPDLESQINSDLKYIYRWLKANTLGFNVANLKQSLWLLARGRNYSP